MTKLANWFTSDGDPEPIDVEQAGLRPATLDDLRQLLADPEVQEALGAEVLSAKAEIDKARQVWPILRPLTSGRYLVVPLSRLEELK